LLRMLYGFENSLNYEEQVYWFISNQKSFAELLLLIKKHLLSNNIVANFNPAIIITNYFPIKIAGYNEFILRLPSLIYGVAAVPLSFFVARKFYSETEGLIVAGFFAFSYFFIKNSQDISSENLINLISLLYIIAAITFFDKIKDSNITSISDSIFVILTGCAFGIYNIKGIILIIITLFLSFFLIKKIKTFLKAFLHFAIIILIISAYAYISNSYSIISEKNIFSLQNVLINFNIIASNNIFITILIFLPLLFLLYIYIKKVFAPKSFGEDARTSFLNSTLFLSVYFFIGICFIILSVYFLKVKFSPNELFFILVPIVILTARALVLISQKKSKQYFGIILFIFFIVTNTYLIQNITSDKNPDYKSTARYLMHKINNFPFSGIALSGPAHDFFSTAPNIFYIKKYNIKAPIFYFDSSRRNLPEIIQTARQNNIKYLWYINDKNMLYNYSEEYILKKYDIIEGLRYNKITLMLVEL